VWENEGVPVYRISYGPHDGQIYGSSGGSTNARPPRPQNSSHGAGVSTHRIILNGKGHKDEDGAFKSKAKKKAHKTSKDDPHGKPHDEPHHKVHKKTHKKAEDDTQGRAHSQAHNSQSTSHGTSHGPHKAHVADGDKKVEKVSDNQGH